MPTPSGTVAHRRAPRGAFTLIELLIVVAIIAILAAIAVPNFLEAQTRARVSRVKADLRSLATGLEAFCVDQGEYPEGTDQPSRYDESIGARLGPLSPGFYAFRTRGNNEVAGRDFMTLTTPIAYMAGTPDDPFADASARFPVCYRNAKDRKNGWIATSVGPDHDLLAPYGVGSRNFGNPLSTATDPQQNPARIGDINERAVIHVLEGTFFTGSAADPARLRPRLEDLSYDPTNGTVSEGDIWRVSP